ncbi:hypothetical protein M413DRAFT_64947 [Hebeloma cylindrosporum]|uniref:Virilizer N-terminal domain-containing protein n=1 Tax=Hebeloma cylindrosporum TaxID=76867 RepID=A0A0C3CCG4_HEBCY|nr:hypothetical protein M413DRAFT_64947 [Hebeloma cylindrosporum h7]
MGLLGWEILPSQNSIAAILFPAPVRISSICVFPTGAQPFANSPQIIAQTEPEAFFLDVYFNAYSIQPRNSQSEKKVVKNALAPTRIAYGGGQNEFTVDMGAEYATRLIIFRGDFKVISVATYGELVEEPSEVEEYEPRPLPNSTPVHLSATVDLANSTTPTLLAEQLLSLLPVVPPLHLATRLIFSLKPEGEEWDRDGFPFLYTDLDIDDNMDLETLVQSVSRPIRDDVSPESLSKFATRMHDSLGSNPSDDAYFVAKLLTVAASQATHFSRTLLQHLDLPTVFNEHTLDETTILCLRDAAAHIEIARYISGDEPFFQSLEDLQSNPGVDESIQEALKKLLSRLRGWQIFEIALTSPKGDFPGSVAFLKDISMGEHSLGCWLECMFRNDILVAKLQENAVPTGSRPLPPLLFQDRQPEVSHQGFIRFVRALVGVASVLGAMSWADSVGNDLCRERALAVLVLLQTVDGYREIVNHCLLLRQLTRRLGWNKCDDVPRKLGISAERLLVGLAKDPQAMLREAMRTVVLELEPPFGFIESEELLEIEKLAMVARDGLLSAIEELAYTSVRPFSLRRLRVLRVSIAVIAGELAYDDGEWHVVENFWSERGERFFPTLIALLCDVSDDLNHHFSITSIPRMNQSLTDLLFRTASDLIYFISQFTHTYPFIGRELRKFISAVADLYICSHAARNRFSSSSPAYLAARDIRQTCHEIIRNITETSIHHETQSSNGHIVLRVLLDHASQSGNRDPVQHLLQLYDLIDNILPPAHTLNGVTNQHISQWTSSVFPKILTELRHFCRLLDPETRALFIERIFGLDDGDVGIGDWLLGEELKLLSTTLHNHMHPTHNANYQHVLQCHISSAIHFLELLLTSPATSTWTATALSRHGELSQVLDRCICLILESVFSSLSLARVARQLAKHATDFSPDVRFNILLLVLRNARTHPTADALEPISGILKSLPSTSISPETLRNEIGQTLSSYSDHSSGLQLGSAESLLQILEWLASQEDIKLTTLAGISTEGFQHLTNTIAAHLPLERQQAIDAVEKNLTIDQDELLPASPTELPEKLTMPLQSIVNLLSPQGSEPSTPKGGTKTPDILGVVISPPTALLRSPAATGLTKTYVNNDFRQLRQTSSTRLLNTSRLPSTHGGFIIAC